MAFKIPEIIKRDGSFAKKILCPECKTELYFNKKIFCFKCLECDYVVMGEEVEKKLGIHYIAERWFLK